MDALVRLAGEVLTHRDNLQGHFHEAGKEKALRDILRVGTSAGGARAKAVIAWNRATNEVRSGPDRGGRGLRILAAEIRRRGGQQGQGTGRPARATAPSSTPIT